MPTGGITRWDWHRAAPGHSYYVPDPYYYLGAESDARRLADFPMARAAHVTARYLVQWADRYWATPSYKRDPQREGQLPDTPEARERFIDELFRWFDGVDARGFFSAEMSLEAGDRRVMDAHDGFPGPLQLTAYQFATLQDRLEQADLPRDFYYPILDQREVVEPVMRLGGVVREVSLYSPRQWTLRDAVSIAAIRVPGEDERKKTFAEACRTFEKAVLLRLAELGEPGKDLRTEEREVLEEFFPSLDDARMRALDRPVTRCQGSPLAGWSHVPTAFEALETSLPALRRLHGDGYVWQLYSESGSANRPIIRWSLSIWLPSVKHSIGYTVINGVPFGPGVTSSIDASGASPIWLLGREERPVLLDSSDALERIEAAGGREFHERTGAELNGLRLQGGAPGAPIWTAHYGRWYPRAGLRISLDAVNGEGLTLEEESTPPPLPPGG